ncbi:MAG: carboxypeptidase regulatory-like domain-containing protein [Bacteroidales bacterium]|nr:carboxypeptidase regulatory-like domain-containing protein [Bacteroidales bacterium]
MKALKIFAFVAAAIFAMSSCTEDPIPPTITWEGNISQYHNPAEGNYNHQIALTVTAEAGISEFTIWKHVYVGSDVTPTIVEGPAGFVDQTSYTYTLDIALTAADFQGGVTKIVYEFVVKDKNLTEESEEFTLFVDEAYNVTFIVNDGQGNAVADAIVTFGETVNTANDYVFEFVAPETYTYSVTKAGYQDLNAADFVLDSDTTITVVLHKLLSAYSNNVLITQSVTSTYATYNDVRVSETENTTIGVKYHTNTTNTIVIKTTTNCEGWVLVDNDTFTTLDEIIAAYAAGTPVTETELQYDYNSKTYAAKYFISKVDGAYLLVKYVDGFVNPTNISGNLGNVIAFQYKN